MNNRNLEHVVALADLRSYSRAAERLGLTQSALTRSIQATERELGLRLFDRSRSGVALTAAGETFAQEARLLVERLVTLRHNAQMLAQGQAGELHFALAPLPAALLLPDMLVWSLHERPGLQLLPDVGPPPRILQALRARKVEFCLLSRDWIEPQSGDIATRVIGRIPLSLLARAGHPLCAGPLTDADIARYPLLSGARHHDTLRSNYAPQIVCDNYDMLRSVTLRTDALWHAAASMASDGLIVLGGTSLDMSVTIVAATLAQRTLSPAAQDAIELATRALNG